ncbi:DUF4376 domain-containing protein [Shumkonia mesophila]|uniref:DUF4376 domain-containing protein n=1 Tax=Shumkonia mesophila TaxID=2838854 RepID=UPI0029352781|nr:DUF4376 domain-containing protein [Shumkonia mesophila]
MLVIVNTENGTKVRAVTGGIARWSDGAMTHAAKAGLVRGMERVVDCRDAVAGAGTLERVLGEGFDGEAWIVTRERYDPPLAEWAAAKKSAVDAERDRRRHPGAIDTGLGWSVDFRDGRDEANIGGLALEAMVLDGQGVTGTVLALRGADNMTRELTPAEMVQVGQAVRRYIADIYAASWVIKGALDAAVADGDRAAVDAVVVATHPAWPVAGA